MACRKIVLIILYLFLVAEMAHAQRQEYEVQPVPEPVPITIQEDDIPHTQQMLPDDLPTIQNVRPVQVHTIGQIRRSSSRNRRDGKRCYPLGKTEKVIPFSSPDSMRSYPNADKTGRFALYGNTVHDLVSGNHRELSGGENSRFRWDPIARDVIVNGDFAYDEESHRELFKKISFVNPVDGTVSLTIDAAEVQKWNPEFRAQNIRSISTSSGLRCILVSFQSREISASTGKKQTRRGIYIYDRQTKKLVEVKDPTAYEVVSISPDCRKVVTAGDETKIFDMLDPGKPPEVLRDGIHFSPNGKFGFYRDENDENNVVSINIESGEQQKIPLGKDYEGRTFYLHSVPGQGNKIQLNGEDGTLELDPVAKTLLPSRVPPSALAQLPNGNFVTSSEKGFGYVSSNISCFDPISYHTEDGDMYSGSNFVCNANAEQLYDSDSIYIKSVENFCREPMSSETTKLWDSMMPSKPVDGASSNGIVVDRKKLIVALMRFQKPGGFILEEHAQLFEYILSETDLFLTEPNLIAGALQNILGISNQLYGYYLDVIKKSARMYASREDENRTEGDVRAWNSFLDSLTAASGSCRTPQENEKLRLAAEKYMDNRLQMDRGASRESIVDFYPLRSLVSEIPKTKRDEMHDKLATEMMGEGNRYGYGDELQGLPDHLRYRMYYWGLAPVFGDPQKAFTEFAIKRTETGAEPVLVSTEPISRLKIDGKPPKPGIVTSLRTEDSFGFSAVRFAKIRGGSDKKAGDPLISGRKITFLSGDRPVEVNLDVQVEETIKIRRDPSPDYANVWKDRKRVGVIFMGQNISDMTTLMDQYYAYYLDQGFEAVGSGADLTDPANFLGEKIKSEADYVLKEAHAGGDAEEFTTLPSQMRVQKLERKLPDGKVDSVYLMYPKTQKNDRGKKIDLKSFGEWVRSRPGGPVNQMTYFNTSCWSCSRATSELAAAKSEALNVVATTTVATTFTNSGGSPLYSVLDDYMKEKTYDEMREGLVSDFPEYKDGKKNVYVFPDEERYKTQILDKLSVPLKWQIRMTDVTTGKPLEQEWTVH